MMERWREDRAAQKRSDRNAVILAALIVAAFVGGMAALINSSQKPRAIPAFKAGEIVAMKLDGRRGMILAAYCIARTACDYTVRFSAASLNTDVHLLGPDGAVVSGAYSDVWVSEFELEASR